MNLALQIFSPIKTALVVIFALLMASCSSEPSDEAALKVAQNFITALEVRDANQAIDRLDEAAVLEVPYPLAAGENVYGSRKMWGKPLREYIHGIVKRNSHISFHERDIKTNILSCSKLRIVKSSYGGSITTLSPLRQHLAFPWRVYRRAFCLRSEGYVLI